MGDMSSNERDYWRPIYFPHLRSRTEDLIKAGKRLVHYTTGQVASSILANREVWMRNASTMNDFMEVQYGWQLLVKSWGSSVGLRFQTAMEDTYPGTVKIVAPIINSWQPLMRRRTYLTCVSEHEPEELEFGRLSMWRAYGADCGVALVLSPEVIQVASPALLGMYSVPVVYAKQSEFDEHLDQVAVNIAASRKAIQDRGPEEFKRWLFHFLRLLVLSTKHPGFSEEREWRVTYSPDLGASPVIKQRVEIVRGHPQVVFKIPLCDLPEHDLIGLGVPALIDRLIIGPTQHPDVVADALRHQLADAGVNDSTTKVVVSQIPLRQF